MINVDDPSAAPERELASAKHSVACFLVAPLGLRWYHALLAAAEAGLAIDFFFLESSVSGLGLAQPYLTRLSAAGGRCFLLYLTPEDWRALRLAPRNLLLIDEDDQPRIAGKSTGTPAAEAGRLFKELRSLAHLADGETMTGYLAGTSVPKRWVKPEPDLQVSFSADATSVPSGRSVQLSWAVVGADRVTLSPGPGEVAAEGQHRHRVTEATEFTLTARCGRRSSSRVLHVGADPRVTLDYWLLAGEDSPTSRARPPAGSPELPDHFGMPAGLPLTLYWRAQNATLVCLDGQALAGLSGSVTLRPSGLTVYELTSIGMGGDEVRRSVTVKTFSPPALVRPEPVLPRKGAGEAGWFSWVKNFVHEI